MLTKRIVDACPVNVVCLRAYDPGRRLAPSGYVHLVVVGRGTVIADTSVADLIAAASGNRITLHHRTGRRDDRPRQRRG